MKSGRRGRAAHPGRILLAAGDRALARDLTAWLIDATACDVTHVRDLRNGWSLCRGGPWCLVLSVSALREGPGLAMLSRSKTLRPHVPTVLMTEYGPGGVAVDELGYVDALLGLPPSKVALSTTVLNLLGRHDAALEAARAGRRPMVGSVAVLTRPAPETFTHPLGFAAPRWGHLSAG